MQIHQIKPKSNRKSRKRVGRGGKRGTYSGRGLKGQKARAGRKIRPQLRDILKKLPKKRGYRFRSIKEKPVPVNLSVLNEKFKSGETVSPQTILEKGIIRRERRNFPAVKLLGTGKITKKIKVSGCLVSKIAKEKIDKAGGEII